MSDYQIGGCRGCDACKKTSICIHHDDVDLFYAALRDAKGLVIGTPIYVDRVTAQLETWLDRLYAYLGPDLENRFPTGVKAVIVAT